MGAPPPYQPPMPRKNNNTVLIVVIILVVLVPCIGLILLAAAGVSFFKNQIGPMAGCMITLESGRNAVEKYVAEKGTYPKAETWQDDIKSYYEKELTKEAPDMGPFKPSPADSAWECKFGEPVTGIAYNSDLSGKKAADIKDKGATILFFEIKTPVKNAHEPYKTRAASESPKFMGEPRGWLKIPLDGGVEGIKNSRRGSIKFGTD